MGVHRYRKGKVTRWKVDTWLVVRGGVRKRFRKNDIPTKELAQALERKAQAEAFEGRWFDRKREIVRTVQQLWDLYRVVSRRHRSWQSEANLAKCLLRHLGKRQAMSLTVQTVDDYRDRRRREKTRRKRPPAAATLDREVELLKRILNYAVASNEIPFNPLAGVKLLREPNVRRVVLDQQRFDELVEHAEEGLRPILVEGYETGMRLEEILGLRRDQVDLKEGVIELAPQDTKTGKARTVFLTDRALAAIESQPLSMSGYVFTNPRTGTRWRDIRKMFNKAKNAAGMPELWFHDLRRSFATEARRRGIPESVVMQMTGHKTTAIFRRYNIIERQDLREAVALFQRKRSQVAEKTQEDAANA
jgi:integrase